MSAGSDFVKKIRPAGMALFLGLAILVTVICFTAGRDPLPGYAPPNTSAYFAEHPQELKTELEKNVFPRLSGIRGAEVSDGTVVITIDEAYFAVSRSAVLKYYDKELFIFRKDGQK